MARPKGLGHFTSPRHREFVKHYAKTLNGTQSAIAAGYPAKKASQTAWTLLKKPHIRAAVDALAARAFGGDDTLKPDRVLEELRRVAFADARTLYGEDGKLKPVSEWTAEQGAAVQQMEVVSGNLDKGDGKRDRVSKVRTWDKVRALELLAKHFVLLTEKQEVTGGITVSWLPPEASAPSPTSKALTVTSIPVSEDNE
jgi:phage terminase small subunit